MKEGDKDKDIVNRDDDITTVSRSILLHLLKSRRFRRAKSVPAAAFVKVPVECCSYFFFSSRRAPFLLFVFFDERIVVVRSAPRNHIQSAFVLIFFSFRRHLRLSIRGGVVYVVRGAKRGALDERR